MPQHIGPVILDLIGPALSAEEIELLQHPLVGGVILFTRNYVSPQQMIELCRAIRRVRKDPLLITVDHEGGRVQRFREGFTRLPSMGPLGKLYEIAPHDAIQFAEVCGWLMAMELQSIGVNLSLAPVLDLNKGLNAVVGDRAFHRQPGIVTELANAITQGMRAGGMAAVAKHFPGHGSVNVDSHLALPTDTRSFESIAEDDLIPFTQLIQSGLPAIMPAHIVFSAVDDKPVGFSKRWLQKILRQQLGFTGVILSDDLNMAGAEVVIDYVQRAKAALEAGCDMILICNNRTAAVKMLDHLPKNYFVAENKFKLLEGKFFATFDTLKASQLWREKHEIFMNLARKAHANHK